MAILREILNFLLLLALIAVLALIVIAAIIESRKGNTVVAILYVLTAIPLAFATLAFIDSGKEYVLNLLKTLMGRI